MRARAGEFNLDGRRGADGKAGGNGQGCGEIIIAESVQVKAFPGQAAAGGRNGRFGKAFARYDDDENSTTLFDVVLKAVEIGVDVGVTIATFGASVCGLVRRLTTAGIPVLAHVGMTPQSVNEYGGFKKQGKTREAAEKVLADAKAVEASGAFAVTLECIPSELAAEITAAVKIPTVGIGAGPVCDAQWLVMHDLLGLNEKVPSFVKKYANLAATVRNAFAAYVGEVKSGTFPG